MVLCLGGDVLCVGCLLCLMSCVCNMQGVEISYDNGGSRWRARAAAAWWCGGVFAGWPRSTRTARTADRVTTLQLDVRLAPVLQFPGHCQPRRASADHAARGDVTAAPHHPLTV
jgi:hypothetical protein